MDLLSTFDLSSILIAGVFGGFFGQQAKRAFGGFKSLFRPFSINPKGNPISRGEVPIPPAALPPAAQLPVSPFQTTQGRRGRRRRGNGTILTGPRGLQSDTAGNTFLGA